MFRLTLCLCILFMSLLIADKHASAAKMMIILNASGSMQGQLGSQIFVKAGERNTTTLEILLVP